MKKIILTVLTILSIGNAFAQSNISDLIDLGYDKSGTEKRWGRPTKHRHVVSFQNGNKIIIELAGLSGYERLKDINSILARVQKNVAAYADTIPPENNQHLLVNYVTSVMVERDKMRFRRVDDGDVFIEYGGGLRRVKVPQDTIRILVYHQDEIKSVRKNDMFSDRYLPLYVNLVLNDYSDIQKILDDNKLQQYLDTMAILARPKKDKGWRDPATSTIFYAVSPNGDKDYISVSKGINEDGHSLLFDKNHDRVSLSANIGAGLVRNKLAPFAEIGLEYRNYWVTGHENYSVTGIYVSPYFLFNQGSDGKYRTYNNWFINAEIGSFFQRNNDLMGLKMKRFTVGAGYLLNPDNLHFQGNTFKAFANLTLDKGVTISPEFIFNNNFKNIFPGLTIKVF